MIWLALSVLFGAVFGLFVRQLSFQIARSIMSSRVPGWRFFSWVDFSLASVGGLLSWLVYALYPTGWFIVVPVVYMAILLFFFITDIEYAVVPRIVVLPAILFAVIGRVFLEGFNVDVAISVLLGGVIGWAIFALQYYGSRGRWVGGGDQDLGLLLGVWLGGERVMVAILLAYLCGAIIFGILLLLRKVSRKTMVPFGVFLIPAGIISWFFGDIIISVLL